MENTEHIALYRRYRPKDFSEVIGQDNIVKILKNQIITEKVAHAYLFSGTRGTGKTSAAKIFAKAVNCEKNELGDPCHVCESCKTIENNNVMDIIEIDAASNRGVDEIRELRERVKYPPTVGRYKVYIIDEVHMLTTEAFNALLKTLEEPPKHIIFILATTEPNKLPTTILSRCQRFHFKRLDLKDIFSRMDYICKEINVHIEDKTLRLIAKNADGAMRDALSILEQCLSISDGSTVDYESVRELLGISGEHLVHILVKDIIQKDIHDALATLEEAYRNGKEIGQLANQMLACLRDILIIKVTNSTDNLIEASEENVDTLKQLAGQVEEQSLSYYIESLSDMENKIKYSTLPKVLMEVLLIRLCSTSVYPKEITSSTVIGNRETVVNKKAEPKIDEQIESKRYSELEPAQNNKKQKEKVREEADSPKTIFDFKTLCNVIKKDKPLLGIALQMGKCKEFSSEKVELSFSKEDNFHYENVDKNKKYIEEQIQKRFNTDCRINCIMEEEVGDDFLNRTKEVFGEDKVFLTDK